MVALNPDRGVDRSTELSAELDLGNGEGAEIQVVLASASPRRRELLSQAGLDFVVDPADVDEGLAPGVLPEAAASELALRKALATADRQAAADVGGGRLIVGADTVVALGLDGDRDGPELLGKPEDEQDARRMLQLLSSSRHRVITGVAVVRLPDGHQEVAWERTWVSMRVITPEEIEAYVRSGEWRGKAGGYAIQENADAFVTGLEEGGFDNVVGLPVELTLGLLERARKAPVAASPPQS